jgi:RNA polymerase sigma-70 factor (ECF subfamily)
MLEDDKIWQRARSGDEQMFYELVRRYERPLFGFLTRCVGDPSKAEDMFQDVFMIVYRNRWKHTGKGQFRSWLYAIALNLVRSRLRKAKRERKFIPLRLPVQDEAGEVVGDPAEMLPDDRAPEPADCAARSEETSSIQDAIAELPQEHRDVVILRVYQHLSFDEIARITGEAVGTLKSRMFYALQKLRPKLTNIAKAGGYLK